MIRKLASRLRRAWNARRFRQSPAFDLAAVLEGAEPFAWNAYLCEVMGRVNAESFRGFPPEELLLVNCASAMSPSGRYLCVRLRFERKSGGWNWTLDPEGRRVRFQSGGMLAHPEADFGRLLGGVWREEPWADMMRPPEPPDRGHVRLARRIPRGLPEDD